MAIWMTKCNFPTILTFPSIERQLTVPCRFLVATDIPFTDTKSDEGFLKWIETIVGVSNHAVELAISKIYGLNLIRLR